MRDVRCKVWDVEFGVQGVGCRIHVLGFGVWARGSGFRVHGLPPIVDGFGVWVYVGV